MLSTPKLPIPAVARGTIQKPGLCPLASELQQLFRQVNLCIDLNLNALFQPSLLRTHLPCMKIHTDLFARTFPAFCFHFKLCRADRLSQRIPGLAERVMERAAAFQETLLQARISTRGLAEVGVTQLSFWLVNSCVTLARHLTSPNLYLQSCKMELMIIITVKCYKDPYG